MIRKGAWAAAVMVPTLIAANFLPRPVLFGLCLVAFVGFAVILFWRGNRRRGQTLFLSGAFLLALLCFTVNYELTYAPIRPLNGQTVDAVVEVAEADGNYYVFKIRQVRFEGKEVSVPGTFSAYLYDAYAAPFDMAKARLTLTIIENNHEVWNRRSGGIYIEAEIVEFGEVQTPESLPVSAYFQKIRQYVIDALRVQVGGEEGGLASAILTSDKDGIAAATQIRFNACGLSHVMAVSGLHLSIVTGYLFLALKKMRFKRTLTCILSLGFVLLIMIIGGFSFSVIRAGIMSGILLLGFGIKKEPDALNSLGIALAGIGLVSPFAVVSVSYLLSGAATLGIIVFAPYLNEKLEGRIKLPKPIKPVAELTTATLSATLFTLPIMILFFGEVSILSIPAMILANIPVTVILLCAAVLCLTSFVPVLNEFLAFLIRICGDFLLKVTAWLSRTGYATLYLRSAPIMVFLVLALIFVVGYVTLAKRNKKAGRYLAAVAGCVLVITLTAGAVLRPGRLQITSYDLGRGDCHCITYRTDAVIVDCASGYAAQTAAMDLRAKGIYHLDALVVTDYRADYADGVALLLEYIPVDCIYLPDTDPYSANRLRIIEAAGEREVPVVFVRQETQVDIGPITLRLYPVPQGLGGLVAQCVFGEFECLFTSTIAADGETYLRSRYGLKLRSEVLMVSRHGIAGTAGTEFLNTVLPEVAIITNSESLARDGNAEVRQRIDNIGCLLYQTGLQGEISIYVYDNGEYYVTEETRGIT